MSKRWESLSLLVAIASYGMKNLHFVNGLIDKYRSMPLKVDVIVLSEAHKDLGRNVEVVVGLPSRDPWSLPFAHKKIFAERLERYDLFAYSEDDMEVSEENIQAFLRVTPTLEPDEIAGFVRFEKDQQGNRSLPDVHGCFHWKPESVRTRGGHLYAEFTNEHSGFYLLTQIQLRRAIASGGFMREPYIGRHDMLCSAATDPYRTCGFRKVICLDEFEAFLIHHLSNRYVGQVGLGLEAFKEQINTLKEISESRYAASTLCGTESKLPGLKWSKSYYEPLDAAVLANIPAAAKTILSVGCGWGANERALGERGAVVTVCPLDSVIGEVAFKSGLRVVNGELTECLKKLSGEKFDCVYISKLLHLLPAPWSALEGCASLVKPGGALVIVNPNFNYLPWLLKRILGLGEAKLLRGFARSGINVFGTFSLSRRLKELGFHVSSICWTNLRGDGSVARTRKFPGLRRRFGRFLADDWILQARRKP